jgi:hypothetical protein
MVSKPYNPLNRVLRLITRGCRSTVQPLVIGVSGSLYTAFRTYDGALLDYYTAKEAGNVRAVREPGDEYIYGPLSRACMM